jgi:nucleotide-binding universal stress UspA family protein
LSGSANDATPFIESVLHPSDFSPASESAFAHALAIALLRETDFTILHVGRQALGQDEWMKFPAVRATLERWGLLEKGSPRSAVFDELAVRVKKVALAGSSPVAAMLDFVVENPADLIVLATEGREGVPRWIRRSKAEHLTRRTRSMTLFVPNAARGFIALEDGRIQLRRILIPVDHHPSPHVAIVYASRAAAALGDGPVEIFLLHVGDGDKIPAIELPEDPACSWTTLQHGGYVVEEIVRAADEREVDLIVMATAGREGLLDALRGSVTEQVLRRAPCPVLAVPDSRHRMVQTNEGETS